MSTISASTTTTTAYVVTADTTGTLVLKTGATPTTALTIGSDQSVTFAGTQTYTGASTFSSGITVQGLTVGKGGGNVATNTALGVSALQGTNTAGSSTAVGYQAGYTNTSGVELTAIGYQAGYGNTSGSSNTSVGWGALKTNSTGSSNHAFGSGALNGNTTGNDNVGIGLNALVVNTSGSNNVAIGRQALTSNTTASNNTAVGYQAGYTNVTGTDSVSVGYQAGLFATGNYNTAVGSLAAKGGNGTFTGIENTAIGYQALTANTSASYNTAVGRNALVSATTGGYNTVIGHNSGDTITTGTKNTILGRYNGNQGGFDIRTASNYIVLSDGDGNPRAWIGAGNNNDLFRVGTTSTSTAGWMHQISYSQTSRYALAVTNDTSAANPSGLLVRYPNSSGASNTDYLFSGENSGGLRAGFYNNGGLSNYSGNNNNLSDRREKTNFAPAKSYLNTICSIPVQTFNYIDQDLENDPGLTLGVVAQDVQAVAPELITETNWGSKEEPKMRLSIYQTDLQYALMKSIQELKAELDTVKAELAALRG